MTRNKLFFLLKSLLSIIQLAFQWGEDNPFQVIVALDINALSFEEVITPYDFQVFHREVFKIIVYKQDVTFDLVIC